jgi:hypothetical protein
MPFLMHGTSASTYLKPEKRLTGQWRTPARLGTMLCRYAPCIPRAGLKLSLRRGLLKGASVATVYWRTSAVPSAQPSALRVGCVGCIGGSPSPWSRKKKYHTVMETVLTNGLSK